MTTSSGLLRSVVALCLFVCSSTLYSASAEKVNAEQFRNHPVVGIAGVTAQMMPGSSVEQALRLGVNESVNQLSRNIDRNGNVHSRYQQTYQGLPVWGQHITVHEKRGAVYRASGKVVKDYQQEVGEQLFTAAFNPSTYATIDNDPYISAGLDWLTQKTDVPASDWNITNFSSRREIYFKDGTATVVRVITLLAETDDHAPVRPTLIIDEEFRRVLKSWNGLTHAEATGPGGNEKIGRYEYGTDYGYLDVTETEAGCALQNENVYTVDLGNGYDDTSTEPFSFECYENLQRETNGAYSPLNDAHYFGNVVFDMFQDWLGVAPLTFQLALKVHYGNGYDNAYWNGESMVFGDGADRFYPLVDINVVSHEVSHGFTEQNSSLIYSEQSGGINEAFSDIAGEAAEYYMNGSVDWLIGAAITKQTAALRYFEDPTQDGRSIGHADHYYSGMDVHHSSGVFNRAYYLISNSEGWNPRIAFEVFAHANQNYWGPSTDFEDGACGVLNSARDLNQSPVDVVVSFSEVGVVCTSDTTDTDGDGLPDGWEIYWGLEYLDPSDAVLDNDNDGLSNLEEYQYQTNPNLEDTDGDTLSDSDEINIHGTSPILADTDEDEMSDSFEVNYGLNPMDPADALLDADEDGFINLYEFMFNTNPLDPESLRHPIQLMYESFEQPLSADWSFDSSNPEASWDFNNDWSIHGDRSLISSHIGSGQHTIVKYLEYFEQGTLSFDYRVSTERGWDYLILVIDDEVVARFSGLDVGTYTAELEAGIHTIEFVYAKDAIIDDHEDTVWIDFVTFESGNQDADEDGMSTLWEIRFGFDPNDPADAQLDFDEDGLLNVDEYSNGSNPTVQDSDGDTLSDGDEVHIHNTSPILVDSDGDLMPDDYEVNNGLNPTDPDDAYLDADSDGMENLFEYRLETDPNDASSFELPLEFLFESFENGIPEGWEVIGDEGEVWNVDGSWSSHGDYSATTVNVSPGQATVLRFNGYLDAGILAFNYRIQDGHFTDFFFVTINGVGEFYGWYSGDGRVNIPLNKGVYEIEFIYYKSSYIGEEERGAWIDAVSFINSNVDYDNDGMDSEWEIIHNLNPSDPSDAAIDIDEDGLSNLAEYENGSDPRVVDSDGDTLSDGDEVLIHNTSPTARDSDEDYMDDAYEVNHGLDPNDPADADLDLDGDGMSNLAEYVLGTDAQDPASNAPPTGYVLESFEQELSERWTTFGTTNVSTWDFYTYWSTDGERSIGSRRIRENQQTTLQYIDYLSAGTLSFDYRVSTHPDFDYLRVYDNGELLLEVSGSQESRFSVELTEGFHNIQFVFNKNQSTIYNGDRVLIDRVLFISNEPDLDGDGMLSLWEIQWGLNPADPADAVMDGDEDGLTNIQEHGLQTNPNLADTDGDTLSDGDEVSLHGTSPLLADSDEDLMDDGFEVLAGLDPNDPSDADLDLDGDGLTNLEEFRLGLDPTDALSVVSPTEFFHDSFEGSHSEDWIFSASSGTTSWQIDEQWSSHGDMSLRVDRPAIGNSRTASITRLFDAGTIAFDYRVNAYDCTFQVFLDGVEVLQIENFQRSTLELELDAGVHTLEFVLHNNSSNYTRYAEIDSVRFLNDNPDIDGDGMPTLWEMAWYLDPENASDADLDLDTDGLTNLEEYQNQTKPRAEDSDEDGLNDGDELNEYGTSPIHPDSDSDQMFDGFEVNYGFDPNDSADAGLDFDGDGYTNLEEFLLRLDPSDMESIPGITEFFHDSFENSLDNWVFTRTGDAPHWQVYDNWSTHGAVSLSMPALVDGQSSRVRLTRLFDAGELFFDYRVYTSSDHFRVYLDGVLILETQSVSTNTYRQEIEAGVHSLEFEFIHTGEDYSSTYYARIDSVGFINSNPDIDGDGMPSAWELMWEFDPLDPADGETDFDSDGLINRLEYEHQSNPIRIDTDWDGLSDGDEVHVHGTSPVLWDTDDDEMDDGFEVQYGLNANDPADANADQDGDGVTNLEEYELELDPTDPLSTAQRYEFFLESFEGEIAEDWEFYEYSSVTPWQIDDQWSTHGDRSLKAGNYSYGASYAVLERLYDAGTLQLDFRQFTSGSRSLLYVYLDGERILRRYGDVESTVTREIEAGVHTLQLTFSNYYNDGGDHYAAIDAVRFINENPDFDGDGMESAWEIEWGFDPEDPSDAALDFDGDGLANLGEFENESNPTLTDTDEDGISDGDEVNIYGSSPILTDSDLDEMSDAYEVAHGLDPADAADVDYDLDGDGVTNFEEFQLGLDPSDPESTTQRYQFFHESFEEDLSDEWALNSTSGAPLWLVDATWSSHGENSLRASGVGAGRSTTASITRLFDAGTLQIDADYYLYSGYYFRVYLDGVQLLNASGDYTRQFSWEIESGIHTVTFELITTGNATVQSNYVAIDAILFMNDDLDIDGDGMPTVWELDWGFDPQDPIDAVLDFDSDGLTNLQEYQNQTDPTLADTDGDTLTDTDEINVHGTSPILWDSDEDEMDDAFEVVYGLNPNDGTDADLDSDGDGITNLEEWKLGLDPTDSLSTAERYAFFMESFEQGLPEDWVLSSSEGATQWQLDDSWFSHGDNSLRITGLSYVQSARAGFTRLFDAGTLQFDAAYRTAASNFRVYVDGELMLYRGGADSAQFSLDIEAGVHSVEFELSGYYSYLEYYAAIDAITFISNGEDADQDGMPSRWELLHGLDPADPVDATQDQDEDGLSNLQEYELQTNPLLVDTDGDLVDDGFEVANAMNALDPLDAELDFDGDGVTNLVEYQLGLDPNDPESNLELVQFFAEDFEPSLTQPWTHIAPSTETQWMATSRWSTRGDESFTAGALNAGESSRIKLNRYLDAGTFAFDYMVDSPLNGASLKLLLNGEELLSQTGEQVGTYSVHLDQGGYTFELIYEQHSEDTNAAAWIDNLRFISDQTDLDNDGLPNEWEYRYGLNPVSASDRTRDADGDGLNNSMEFVASSNPSLEDTDSDGLSDIDERDIHQTFLINADSDNDGLSDGYEVANGFNPLNPSDGNDDADFDGLTNLQESILGTNAQSATSSANPYLNYSESFEESDFTQWKFPETATGATWMRDENWSSNGDFSLSALASDMRMGEDVRAEISLLLVAGTISFDLNAKIASTHNGLTVWLDNQAVYQVHANETGVVSIPVAAGAHRLAFTYHKAFPREDVVYIDNLQFIADDNTLDMDGDDMLDEWELEHGLNPNDDSDADLDFDNDGISNYEEYLKDFDPQVGNIDLQLIMTKLSDNSSSEIHYRVRLENIGDFDASDIVIMHEVNRPEFDFTVPEGSPMLCELYTEISLRCTLDSLPSGAREEIVFVVYTNQRTGFHSSVVAGEVDYEPENNVAIGSYTAGKVQWLMLIALSALYYMRRRSRKLH